MAESDFDDLLKRLPAIAKVVNAFTSEAVQRQAFDVLVGALAGVPTGPVGGKKNADFQKPGRRRRTKQQKEPKRSAKSGERQGRRSGPSLDRKLSLRPKGRQSFKDFATAKAPKTALERNVVAVHWLQGAGVKPVGPDQVYTCYSDMGWRRPTDIYNSLAVTASKKGWLDTADMNDVKV